MNDIDAAGPEHGWQPLPDAARIVYRVNGLLGLGLPGLGGAVAVFVLAGSAFDRSTSAMLALPVLVLVLAIGLGWLLGGRRHGRIRVRLDDDGLSLRRGLCWRSETLIPRSRVQHMDIERGPLLRRLGLATLVTHTAGTRLNALRVVGLDLTEARRIRDALVDRAAGDDDAV